MERLFKCSQEFPIFILCSLDLLLIHSFRAMTKAVNMFKTAAQRHLGIADLKSPSSRRQSCNRDVENNEDRGDCLR